MTAETVRTVIEKLVNASRGNLDVPVRSVLEINTDDLEVAVVDFEIFVSHDEIVIIMPDGKLSADVKKKLQEPIGGRSNYQNMPLTTMGDA